MLVMARAVPLALFGWLWALPAFAVLEFEPSRAMCEDADTDGRDDLWVQVSEDGFGGWMATWQSGLFPGCFGYGSVRRSGRDGRRRCLGSGVDRQAVGKLRPGRALHPLDRWRLHLDDPRVPELECDHRQPRSTDGGSTWSAPAALSSSATSDTDDDYTEGLATDGAGTWLVVWVAVDVSLEGDVLASRSVDAGASWSADSVAMTNRFASDLPPDLATDRAGNWVAAWGTIGSPWYRVSAIHSRDDGDSWSARKEVAVSDHSGEATIAGQVATLRDPLGWMVVYPGDIPGTGDSPDIHFSTGLDLNPG